jgi:hypothetical protein
MSLNRPGMVSRHHEESKSYYKNKKLLHSLGYFKKSIVLVQDREKSGYGLWAHGLRS